MVSKHESMPLFAANIFGENSTYRSHASVPAWRVLYTLGLCIVDTICMLVPLFIIFLNDTYVHKGITDVMPLPVFICASIMVWLISMAVAGTYERHIMEQGYVLYRKLINGSAVAIVFGSCISYFGHLDLPRMAMIVAPIVARVLTILARWAMRVLLHASRKRGKCGFSTILVGSEVGIVEALKLTNSRFMLGYNPVAYCPIERVAGHEERYRAQAVSPEGKRRLAHLREIPLNNLFVQEIERHQITEVFVVDTLSQDSRVLYALALAVESLGIELALSIPVAGVGGHRIHLSNDSIQPIITASLPQYNRGTAFLRRVIDIIGSLCALLVFSVIMIAVAIAVKVDDPSGPVLFKQTRVGLRGKPFTMLKFRSMKVDAERRKRDLAAQTGQLNRFIFKIKDDPRVTRVGKFIRKYSLDELPQFFNVLKGDMSLVGPRPALPDEVERYSMVYSSRLLVKPGITGPWQVSGRSDLTREQSEFLDVSYVENWSLSGDVAILCKTVLAVLRGTGY